MAYFPRRLAKWGVLLLVFTLSLSSGLPQISARSVDSGLSAAVQDFGHIIADTGFRPAVNGFSFANYGNNVGAENLTVTEMRALFGDQVCAILKNDVCVLTPLAAEQMDKFNQAMASGHCDGLATLSLLMYEHVVSPAAFGADTAAGLQFQGNDLLQRQVAEWFTTQLVDPTYAAKLRSVKDKIAPAQLLDTLIKAMNDKSESYTIAFFKPGYRSGHAVTPYAVADEGNGIYHILIYDNNFPGQERAIEVDQNANTWKYAASVNPDVPQSLYTGDDKTGTLMLIPLSLRLKKQTCAFCQTAGQGGSGIATAAPTESNAEPTYNELLLTSTAEDNQLDLLIKDDQGNRLGYENGEFYDDIPNAFFVPVTSDDLWQDDPEPLYYVPTGIHFTVVLDGSALSQPETASLSLFGPDYDTIVDDIHLAPGQKDTATFSPDGSHLTYQPGQSETPHIIFDISQPQADYELQVQGINLDANAAVHFALDSGAGALSFNATGVNHPATFTLEVNRVDDQTDDTFYHDGIDLAPGATAYVDFAQWDGAGAMPIGVDDGSNGQIDQTLQEPNMPSLVGAGYIQTAASGSAIPNPDGSYQLQLFGISASSVHVSAVAPLDMHPVDTDQLAKAWSTSNAKLTTDAVIELDHLSVYAELSAPVSDPANHTLTYTATIDQVLPTGADTETVALPQAFGVANLLINESSELFDALAGSSQLQPLTSGGDFNVNAGNLDLTSGGDFNVNAGTLPGSDASLLDYYQSAQSGSLTANGNHYSLTLRGVYPMLLAASASPTLGLAWVSSDALHKAWATGGSATVVNAILDTNGKQVALRLSNPQSDAGRHTLSYDVESPNVSAMDFGAANLLISRDATLEAALNVGTNGAAGIDLTSGGDFNVNAGALTNDTCHEAVKQLTDQWKPDTANETLVGLNDAVESACSLSAALFTPDARRKSAHVSELTLLPAY